MTIATSPEKSHPLFPSNPPLKVEVLSSHPSLKIWLEAHTPPPLPERGGCTLWTVQICTVIKLNNSNISKKIYLAKHFVQKSGNSKYYNALNSKFHYEYLSAYFNKIFRTQLSFKPSSRAHFALSINKSEHRLC